MTCRVGSDRMHNNPAEPPKSGRETRWVARLTPTASGTVEMLLRLPLALDVWQRQPDMLVVAASEAQLAEIERRRLAHVELLSTVTDYVQRAQERARDSDTEAGGECGRRGTWS
jgi:hypothetical protein